MDKPRSRITIRSFLLLAALAGSLLIFAGAYAVVSAAYDRSVREDARNVSALIAGQTFDAMYQLMRKERRWRREELEAFLEALRVRFADSPYTIQIHRGESVDAHFGAIPQPPPDGPLREALAGGRERVIDESGGVRYLFPLVARRECLRCHENAAAGDTLGVIDVRMDLRPELERARADFMVTLGWIVPMMVAGAVGLALLIHLRLGASLRALRDQVGRVNKVSDLVHFRMDRRHAGFGELDEILTEVRGLADRLHDVAVDKDLLQFEIRLLQRFIITSDVVRDWREYIKHLLAEINEVMEAYVLFTLFKVEEEVFNLEVFWRDRPAPHTVEGMERSVRAVLQRHPCFGNATAFEVHHHVVHPDRQLPTLDAADIELQSKSLFVETPMIGGIVGIGVQAGVDRDPGRLLVMESVLSTLLNVVGSVRAIHKYTKELEYYATRDPLTDLYNQRTFWELLEYELDRAGRKNERLALLVIDLDNFKDINDTYGHAFGDRFLQAFAGLLRRVFRLGDVVARYGGDEFVVLVTDAPDNQAWTAAVRLLEECGALALEAPDGRTVHISVTVGIALYPDHAESARDLFLIADNMMYQAKEAGKDRVLLAGEDDVTEVFRGVGEQNVAITAALRERRFVPHFQPIVAAGGAETPLGFEVLSRLRDGGGGESADASFIPVAERMGVVHRIDYQVMEHAFEAARRAGFPGKLFVNLSPKALILSEFVPTAARLAGDAGIDPGQVVFELSERETVRNIALLERFVRDLKLRGFQFAVDDFGSGLSSFHHLRHFPIDYVKIDGQFIGSLTRDERDRVFVRHLAAMAGELGVQTVAEFVEDAEVLAAVREAGIDYAQGYFIGRPSATLDWE